MHLIASDTRIRAAAYASALRLPDSEWTHLSDGQLGSRKATVVHILPSVAESAGDALSRVAQAHQLKVYDHR